MTVLAKTTSPAPTRFHSVAAFLAARRPRRAVYALYPHRLLNAVRRFRQGFPGETVYAVKVNPEPMVIRHLHAAGLRRFDTASLAEIALVREIAPEAQCYYMAPVRPLGDAEEAYRRFGVRHFALDSVDELGALHAAVDQPGGVTLYVRLRTKPEGAMFELSSKFGVPPAEAAELLDRVCALGFRAALTFHVGSQCTASEAYGHALDMARETLARSRAPIVALDVGGGFPAPYPGLAVPPLEEYFTLIGRHAAAMRLPATVELLAEPGRALVADGLSLVCQVMQRKDNRLYINDGAYGSLMEARLPGSDIHYPTRTYRADAGGAVRTLDGSTADFTLYGPTCDSYDVLPRPYALPRDIATGDWIEFGLIGAYSLAMRTQFNGFYTDTIIEIERGDEPPLA